jgi:hypothetical protein
MRKETGKGAQPAKYDDESAYHRNGIRCQEHDRYASLEMRKAVAPEVRIGEDPKQKAGIGLLEVGQEGESLPESLGVLQQKLHPENAEDRACGHEQKGKEEQKRAALTSTLLDEQGYCAYQHGVDRQKQIAGAVAAVTDTGGFFDKQLVLFEQIALEHDRRGLDRLRGALLRIHITSWRRTDLTPSQYTLEQPAWDQRKGSAM